MNLQALQTISSHQAEAPGTILDHRGVPVRSTDLDKAFAAPTAAGIRPSFFESIVSGLTPLKLGQILQNAARGDDTAFLTIAEEMEERDGQYSSTIRIRKTAIMGLPIQIEAASDDPKDIEIADEVTTMTEKRGFRAMLFNALDALGKGYSMVEINWDRTDVNEKGQPRFTPKSFDYRDPRHFQWDSFTGTVLRIRDLEHNDLGQGRDIPAFKFIFHKPLIKSGLAFRGGLARIAAAYHILKSFGLKDWMALAEIFGIPLRIGRFTPAADKEGDVDKLVLALAELGARGTVAIPKSMDIQIENNRNASASSSIFKDLLEYLDRQMSKIVLGQTMTSDAGSSGSLAQAQIHEKVREDIRSADALHLSETINRDLIEPYVVLNFPGPHFKFPQFKLLADPPEDLEQFSTVVTSFVKEGLKVQQSWVRDKIGAPEPEEGAEVLGVPEKAETADEDKDEDEDDDDNDSDDDE